MKYKFLLSLHKCMSLDIKFSKSNKSVSISEGVYNNSISKSMEFKRLNPNLDYHVIDMLYDNLILGGFLDEENIDKRYKAIKLFLRECNALDFKILHKFRMFLESNLKLSPVSCENAETLVYFQWSNLQAILSLVTVLEGGVLYTPLNIRGITINLGTSLDDLMSYPNLYNEKVLVNYDRSMLDFLDSDLEDIDVVRLNPVKFINNLLKKTVSMTDSIFSCYYLNLIELYFALQDIRASLIFESYIDTDMLKFSYLQYVTYLGGDEISSISGRFFPVSEVYDVLYKREVLIPNSGIAIKLSNSAYKDDTVVVCECDDEVFGHSVYILEVLKSSGCFNFSSLYLESRNGFFNTLNAHNECLFDLFKIKGYLSEGVDFVKIVISEMDSETGHATFDMKNTRFYNEPYEVFLPTYWKYKGSQNGTASSGHTDAIGSKIKSISPFKRRLSRGMKRSSEADNLAKKLCIHLEDNETVVSSFEREYRVKL